MLRLLAYGHEVKKQTEYKIIDFLDILKSFRMNVVSWLRYGLIITGTRTYSS
jgi:hypothetical protein